ncbi:MAG: lamin tail domain-containing protein [Verrucomicrobiales bacterium]
MSPHRTCSCRRACVRLLPVALLLALCAQFPAMAEVEAPEFSVSHGFREGPFQLAISSDTDGATLRFTTDSSEPTLSNGNDYSHPLIINRTTIVRAAAFKDGMDASRVTTQTYLFLDDVVRQTGDDFPADWGDLGTFGTEPGNHPPGPHAADYAMDADIVDHPDYAATIIDDLKAIPSLSVVLDRDDLFSTEVVATDPQTGEVSETRGIYPVGKGFERAASVELLLPDGGEGFQIDGSVEIQGATSTDRWKTAKLSMRLKFKAPYGPSELDYPLFGDDASDNVNTVILDSTNQQSWTHPVTSQQLRAQYVRDQFVGDLQNAMGGIAPHGRYAHLYLDGLYWGVYWMHEFVEEAFAVAYRGGKKSEFDIMRHRADNAIAGNGDDYNEMVAAASGDLSSPEALALVESYLDLPQFADYILVNFYSGNADWAFQNWNATRNRVDPDSRWLFHNWDGEKTFQDLGDNNTDNNDEGAPTFLHQQLLANEEYRLIFADRVRRHCFNGGVLTPSSVIDRYLWRTGMIDRAIVGESARWGDNRNPDDAPYTREAWVAERDRLIGSYFPERTGVLLAQLREDGLYPDVEAPEFGQHGGEVAAGYALTVSHENADGVIFYTTDGSDPRDPGASTYTVPLVIGSSQVVKARVLSGDEWSALSEAVFRVPAAISDLRVTEIHFHPGEPDEAEEQAGFDDEDSFEFIELRNTGPAAVDLDGVTFVEAITFTFPPRMLPPGESVIVVNDRAAFEKRYPAPAAAAIAGEFSGSLANSGESIGLRGRFGEMIQSFTYSDAWYPSTDGDGASLVITEDSLPAAAWDLPSSWRPSTLLGGSPGAVDAPPIPLRITEIHYHPEKPDSGEELAGFTDDSQFEFVEVRNVGSSPVALAGIRLSDGVEFTFPGGNLAPGAYTLVVSDLGGFAKRYGGGLPVAGAFTSGTLSDSGERLMLIGPGGERIHDFKFDDDWHQVTDGGGASLVIRDQALPTHTWADAASWRASLGRHGSPNAGDGPPPPALRITEIMYHPGPLTQAEFDAGYSQDDFDFIELANTGDAPIALGSYSLSVGVTFSFPNVVLNPGRRVLIVEDDEAFAARFGAGLPVIGSWSGSLSDSDDRIVLRSNGVEILDFTYEDDWYPITDGEGPSLTIVDEGAHPLSWDDEDGWRPSGQSGATPGWPGDPGATWLWEHFDADEFSDPQIGGLGADPDGDGLANRLEFALALDPRKPQPAPAADFIEIGGDFFLSMTIRHDRRATFLQPEVSADLNTWSGSPIDLETYISEDIGGGIDRLTIRDMTPIDFSSPRRFMRISAPE